MSSLQTAQAALDRKDWMAARQAFDALNEPEKSSLKARYGRAIAQLEIGEVDEAEATFDALLTERPKNTAIRFMRGKSRLISGRTAEGVTDLETVWQVKPDITTLRLLAGIAWMRGEFISFEARLNSIALKPEFAAAAADILREAGQPEGALALLINAPEGLERHTIEASIQLDLGNAPAAEAAAVRALTLQPGFPVAVGHLITALLMQGKAADAMEAVNIMRRADPLNQRWLADESTALRLSGDRRFNELLNLNMYVRAFELPVPPSFESIETFNSALAETLAKYQPYDAHPLGQSLRGGIQTSRGLTSVDDPVVKAYLAALDAPIRQYLRYIGNDPSHPLTRRNTGNYQFAGSWSVKLHGGGNHVNHVHSDGWISSAYYVSVPDETTDEARRAGWIKFAEPPYPTIPPSPPLKWIQPKAGTLVLFPSYLWHGTTPIDEGSSRVTAPFDIIPA